MTFSWSDVEIDCKVVNTFFFQNLNAINML